jgi:hypothetical protein
MTPIQTLQERDKAAAILTPLIKQIFHGENFTSEKIHEEMDKVLDRMTEATAQAYVAGMRRCLELLPEQPTGFPKDDITNDIGYGIGYRNCRTEIETAITQEIKSLEK